MLKWEGWRAKAGSVIRCVSGKQKDYEMPTWKRFLGVVTGHLC